MKKLKIGIDIDNVISNSYPEYIKKFNFAFGTSICFEEVTEFSFLEKYEGIENSRAEVFISTLLEDKDFQLTLPPFSEAITIIKKWHKKGYSTHYITARPSFTQEVTEKWLAKHGLMIPGVTLDSCDYGKDKLDTEFKREAVERLGIDVFIEDSKEIAIVMDIPVLLFDRPWNQGKLPKNAKRVNNWQQIDQFIEQYEVKKRKKAYWQN